MAYQHTKDHGALAKEPSIHDPMTMLLARLTRISLLKPRKPIPYNLWVKANPKTVEKEFEFKCKVSLPKKKDHLNFLGQVTRKLFEKLPPEERADWGHTADKEHQTAMAEWSRNL
jgi:hypothetical protein